MVNTIVSPTSIDMMNSPHVAAGFIAEIAMLRINTNERLFCQILPGNME